MNQIQSRPPTLNGVETEQMKKKGNNYENEETSGNFECFYEQKHNWKSMVHLDYERLGVLWSGMSTAVM